LFIGEDWHGSNATALARGFRALGNAVEVVSANRYFPELARQEVVSRLLRRMFIPFFMRHFNLAVIQAAKRCKPHLVVIYKGTFVSRETLVKLKEMGFWIANFFPDVSPFAHRDLDPGTFAYYDHIFTTKSFGVKDFKRLFNLDNVSFIPHGFDPLVHRKFPSSHLYKYLECDASFIGGYSPHKEEYLAYLKDRLPHVKLRIFGGGWDRAKKGTLRRNIAGYPIYGDYYALAIQASKINIGLLLERIPPASSGDLITSRTFHIPAAGGFLLHERTKELLQYFVEGKEVACFDSKDELIEKVEYYLKHENERLTIALKGHEKCIKNYSYTERARIVIETYEKDKWKNLNG